MNPRSLGEWELGSYVDALDFAINLHHIILQLGDVALSITPYNIRCIVIVDEDGWVDASPTVLGIEAILVGQQWFAQCILVRARNLIAYSHTNATPVGRNIPVVLAVSFHHMSGVCLLALCPLEIRNHQWGWILGPMLHIGGRENLPVVHFVTRMIALGIMTSEKPQGVLIYQNGRVGSIDMREERITCCHEVVLQHIAPLLLQSLHLVLGYRTDRTMTRKEILAE